jgi:hypothetical protein
MNKWKIFIFLILVSCSSNKNFVSIDSANHATIEVLEKIILDLLDQES